MLNLARNKQQIMNDFLQRPLSPEEIEYFHRLKPQQDEQQEQEHINKQKQL